MASEIELASLNTRRQTPSEVAVQSNALNSSTFEDSPTHYEAALPPPDRGKDAYLFLATCFVVESFVWGMPRSCTLFYTSCSH
jgi:hypothetical protein